MAAQQRMNGGPPATSRAAVLGCPVAHSLSPQLHRAAYAALGLDWSYDAIEVAEPELPGFMTGLDASWAGLSLTMPLKRAVLPLLDEVRGVAATVEAVNTVVLTAGGRIGYNTDVPGIVAAIGGELCGPRTAVLGGGATAASALAAIASLGAQRIEMYVRDAARATQAKEIAARLGVDVEIHSWADAGRALGASLVISTTPAGTTDGLASYVPTRPGQLFDVVYHAWPTQLAAAWEDAGGAVVGGLELLVQQAARQVELMTGRTPTPVDAMRSAGLAALSKREHS